MPPRSSLTSSFSITDANNEVVCPLRNQDGSSCRKRCIGVSSHCPCLLMFTSLPAVPRRAAPYRAVPCRAADQTDQNAQEKRYRSMQEHIRRAHPEHYISKLPATEESFMLMINTPPSERPQSQQQNTAPAPAGLSGSPLPAPMLTTSTDRPCTQTSPIIWTMAR